MALLKFSVSFFLGYSVLLSVHVVPRQMCAIALPLLAGQSCLQREHSCCAAAPLLPRGLAKETEVPQHSMNLPLGDMLSPYL